MNPSSQKIDDQLLQRYVDDELSASEKERVSTYLNTNPEAMQRMTEYQQINQMLSDLHVEELESIHPDAHELQVYAQPPSLYLAAASVAWLTIGGLVGWLGHSWANPTPSHSGNPSLVQALAHPAQLSYAVYSPEVLHPIEVSAEQEQHLASWLTKRLGKDVSIPNLENNGYQLLGGRLLAEGEGPAALFMYENSVGQRITLHLKQIKSATPTAFQFDEDGDIRTFYWVDNGFGYALTGELDKHLMLTMSQAVYHQLSL